MREQMYIRKGSKPTVCSKKKKKENRKISIPFLHVVLVKAEGLAVGPLQNQHIWVKISS